MKKKFGLGVAFFYILCIDCTNFWVLFLFLFRPLDSIFSQNLPLNEKKNKNCGPTYEVCYPYPIISSNISANLLCNYNWCRDIALESMWTHNASLSWKLVLYFSYWFLFYIKLVNVPLLTIDTQCQQTFTSILFSVTKVSNESH